MAGTLLEQFLSYECAPHVRQLLENAINDLSMLQPFFEFNRFEITIDRENGIVILADVLDATDDGVQHVLLSEFTKAMERHSEKLK
jgi:hypothetical protein